MVYDSAGSEDAKEKFELPHGMLLLMSAYPKPCSSEHGEREQVHRPAFPGYRVSIAEAQLRSGKPVSGRIAHVTIVWPAGSIGSVSGITYNGTAGVYCYRTCDALSANCKTSTNAVTMR